jgi:hypothetical protein
MFEAEAVSAQFDDLAFMQDSVENGGGDGWIAKQITPILRTFV